MTKQKNYKKTLIACYLGFVTQAISANFTPLLFLTFKSTYGITLDKIAMIPMVFYLTQLLVDLAATKFADKIGYRICVVASQAVSAAGLVLMAVLPEILPVPFQRSGNPAERAVHTFLQKAVIPGGKVIRICPEAEIPVRAADVPCFRHLKGIGVHNEISGTGTGNPVIFVYTGGIVLKDVPERFRLCHKRSLSVGRPVRAVPEQFGHDALPCGTDSNRFFHFR